MKIRLFLLINSLLFITNFSISAMNSSSGSSDELLTLKSSSEESNNTNLPSTPKTPDCDDYNQTNSPTANPHINISDEESVSPQYQEQEIDIRDYVLSEIIINDDGSMQLLITTVIHKYVQENKLDELRALLKDLADTNPYLCIQLIMLLDSNGDSCLNIAANGGYEEVIRELLEYCRITSEQRDFEVIKLIQRINRKKPNALHVAVSNNHQNTANILIKEFSASHKELEADKQTVADFITSTYCSSSEKITSPFHSAIDNNNLVMLTFLVGKFLEFSDNINQLFFIALNGVKPLITYAQEKDTSGISEYLTKKYSELKK